MTQPALDFTKARFDGADSEEWRPIPDCDGRYEASDLGRIRSLWFKTFLRAEPKILRQAVCANGYRSVRLGRDTHGLHVHRLVLLAFRGAPPTDHIGGHRDGNPSNNALTNLAWITYSQNNGSDRWLHGTALSGRKNPNAKLTDDAVLEIRRRWRLGGVTAKELGQMFGVSAPVAHKVAIGKAWRHVA